LLENNGKYKRIWRPVPPRQSRVSSLPTAAAWWGRWGFYTVVTTGLRSGLLRSKVRCATDCAILPLYLLSNILKSQKKNIVVSGNQMPPNFSASASSFYWHISAWKKMYINLAVGFLDKWREELVDQAIYATSGLIVECRSRVVYITTPATVLPYQNCSKVAVENKLSQWLKKKHFRKPHFLTTYFRKQHYYFVGPNSKQYKRNVIRLTLWNWWKYFPLELFDCKNVNRWQNNLNRDLWYSSSSTRLNNEYSEKQSAGVEYPILWKTYVRSQS
jgi:hypothetical protein